jgi:hypothetical protein
MTYPDSTKVSIGDHIWWNEGSCVGFVQKIVESESELKNWGFDEPQILLSGLHPFDPGEVGYVSYQASDFGDEGIERFSPAEEADFERAQTLARSDHGLIEPFHVGFDTLSDSGSLWIFSCYEGGKLREVARIKCRIEVPLQAPGEVNNDHG